MERGRRENFETVMIMVCARAVPVQKVEWQKAEWQKAEAQKVESLKDEYDKRPNMTKGRKFYK